MSVWAVVDGDAILSPSILCGEHANDPAVLNRVWEQIKVLAPGVIPGFEVLGPEDAALVKDCVECARLAADAAQPVLTEQVYSPFFPSQGTTEEDPEQGEAEEPVEYVHEKMDAVAPVPWDMPILDAQTDEAENGVTVEWLEPMVELQLTVVETVQYPAAVMIPKRRYEEVLALFPQLKRHALPLGLMLRIARDEGATVVVDERHGDVQGQTPAGPVREGQTHGNQ